MQTAAKATLVVVAASFAVIAGKLLIDAHFLKKSDEQREDYESRAEMERTMARIRAQLEASHAPPEDPRITAASAVWTQFDALRGPQFRTSAMLQAHLLLAEQQALHLPAEEAAAIHAFNGREYRRRLPALFIVGETGRGDGDDAEIIVPSTDAARCPVLAAAWLKDGTTKQLAGTGYKTMKCGTATWPLGK